jgi:hypothetical protein
MIQRCTNPKNPAYHWYGGRGITVCERWLSSANFLADMGKRPSPKHSLDRKDNGKGYEPGNCRWATVPEQLANRRPRSVFPRGERVGGAKLNAAKVRVIRKAYALGISFTELSSIFGLRRSSLAGVCNVSKRPTWRHVVHGGPWDAAVEATDPS